MLKVNINNRAMHYRDEGQGPVILFGHSYLWDNTMWREQVAVLSQTFRCIVPDLWGHGDSDPVDETPTIQSLTEDYWQFMRLLQIHRFSIVGLSVGGMWGTQMALDHPESVDKLVLMDTFVGAEQERTRLQYFQMLDVVAKMQRIPEPMIAQLLPIFLSRDTLENNSAIADIFAQILANVPAEKIATIVALGRAIFSRDDLLHRLPDLQLPVLVMTGEFDMPRPVDETRQMAEMINGAEFRIIRDAGHISALEQPAQVNIFLKHFFDVFI
jgi:pimeloyl-ACP methyl ester carboxylesterase